MAAVREPHTAAGTAAPPALQSENLNPAEMIKRGSPDILHTRRLLSPKLANADAVPPLIDNPASESEPPVRFANVSISPEESRRRANDDFYRHSILVPGSRKEKRRYYLAEVMSEEWTQEQHQERFDELVPQLQSIVESDVDLREQARWVHYTMEMVGSTPDTATPSVVVECRVDDLKPLRKLFRRLAKEKIYCGKESRVFQLFGTHRQPQYPFQLVFFPCSSPPITRMASEEVITAHFDTEDNWCGGLVSVKGRTATVGVALQIDDWYGVLTVDHVLRPVDSEKPRMPDRRSLSSIDSTAATLNNDDLASINGLWVDESDDSGEDDENFVDLPVRPPQTTVGITSASTHLSSRCLQPPTRGSWVRVPPKVNPGLTEPYLDYAIFRPRDRATNRSVGNYVVHPGDCDRDPASRTLLLSVANKPRFHGVPIYVISGARGILTGKLLGTSNYIPGQVGQPLCQAWAAVMESESEILAGDCGSVVVDQDTLEIYGYVIGATALGHACVVPLSQAIAQIRDSFMASSVRLPQGGCPGESSAEIDVATQFDATLPSLPEGINDTRFEESLPVSLPNGRKPRLRTRLRTAGAACRADGDPCPINQQSGVIPRRASSGGLFWPEVGIRPSGSPGRVAETKPGRFRDEQPAACISPLARFRLLRKRFERVNTSARAFVLHDRLTAALCEDDTSGDASLLRQLVRQALHGHVSTTNDFNEMLAGLGRIFFILVELGCPELVLKFAELGLDDSHLPIDPITLRANALCENDSFYDAFNAEQYAWCPLDFHRGMSYDDTNRINPVCREDPSPLESAMYVLVPEDLVAKALRMELSHAQARGFSESDLDVVHGETERMYCRFKVQSLCSPTAWEATQAHALLENLSRLDGFMGVIGTYHDSQAPHVPDHSKNTSRLNAVFETTTQNLSTLMEGAPPQNSGQVDAFWRSLVPLSKGLESIHALKIQKEDNIWYGFHADIRPANIFYCDGKLKLSEPSLARILRPYVYAGGRSARLDVDVAEFSRSRSTIPMTSNDVAEQNRISQSSDMWALGCLLSQVAAWLTTGLPHSSHFVGPAYDVAKSRAILRWHEHLRVCCNPDDNITPNVLRLLGEHVLVPESMRYSASQFSGAFQEVFDLSKPPRFFDCACNEDFDLTTTTCSLGLEPGKKANGCGCSTDASEAQRTWTTTEELPRAFQLQAQQLHVATSLDYRPNAPHEPKPTTVWMLEDEMVRICKETKHTSSRSKLGSLRSKMRQSKPPVINTYIADTLFDNRDITFLVDNTRSMDNHWREARHLLNVLVWRCIGCNNDGLDLFFTQSSPTLVRRHTRIRSVEEVLDAMDDSRAHLNKNVAPRLTPVVEMLSRILQRHYIQQSDAFRERKLSIVVLTDGVWEGDDQAEAEIFTKFLQSTIRPWPPGMNAWKGASGAPSVSVQFVRFGHDASAQRRLAYLDALQMELGEWDIVDTEASYGDVYKMLLGRFRDQGTVQHRDHYPVSDLPTPPDSVETDSMRGAMLNKYPLASGSTRGSLGRSATANRFGRSSGRGVLAMLGSLATRESATESGKETRGSNVKSQRNLRVKRPNLPVDWVEPLELTQGCGGITSGQQAGLVETAV